MKTDMNAQVYKKLNPRQYVERFLSNGLRPDGRSLKDDTRMFRKLNITIGSIGSALGSAMLKLGNTKVVAGVNAELGPPEEGTGTLEVVADVKPFASRYTKPQSVSPSAALATHVRSTLMPFIDLSALVVESDELAWRLTLTIYCIDADGNVTDAALLAAVAALRDLRLPTISALEGDDGSDDGAVASIDERVTLPISFDTFPLSVSFALIGAHALPDPTHDEEEAADGVLTLLVSARGELRAALKPGGAALEPGMFATCMRLAAARAPEIASKIDGAKKQADS